MVNSKREILDMLNKSISTCESKCKTQYRVVTQMVKTVGFRQLPIRLTPNGNINVGFIVESLIKKAFCKKPTASGRNTPDIVIDNVRYEIKCSLGSKSYNTPVTNELPVILVNRLGAFLVTKKDFTPNGIFAYNKPYGLRLPTLSKQLGL